MPAKNKKKIICTILGILIVGIIITLLLFRTNFNNKYYSNGALIHGYSDVDSYIDNSEIINLIKNYKVKVTDEEKAFFNILQDISGQQIKNYTYVDMNKDGINEFIGICLDDDNYYEIWFVCDNGKTCKSVGKIACIWDDCKIELLNYEQEIHVVVNAYNLMGNNKKYTILSFHNNEIQCLSSNQYGYVYMNDNGDVILNIESYDGIYDADIGSFKSHTWKDAYLYYDGISYKEYGATQISESLK